MTSLKIGFFVISLHCMLLRDFGFWKSERRWSENGRMGRRVNEMEKTGEDIETWRKSAIMLMKVEYFPFCMVNESIIFIRENESHSQNRIILIFSKIIEECFDLFQNPILMASFYIHRCFFPLTDAFFLDSRWVEILNIPTPFFFWLVLNNKHEENQSIFGVISVSFVKTFEHATPGPFFMSDPKSHCNFSSNNLSASEK